MAVIVAVGHRLARHDGLTVADILDERFVGVPDVHPQWRAFWHLQDHRHERPEVVEERVPCAWAAAEAVASGRAIATVPAWAGDGIPHPGIITVPLHDGPAVETRLVWRAADANPAVRALTGLAAAWSGLRRPGPSESETGPQRGGTR